MAGFAFFAEAPLVDIVFAMALGTDTRRTIVECRTPVAVTATRGDMAVTQRESGFRVVECPALPSGNRVTVVAVDTELVFMHIILEVTGDAGFRSGAILLSGDVTAAAFDA